MKYRWFVIILSLIFIPLTFYETAEQITKHVNADIISSKIDDTPVASRRPVKEPLKNNQNKTEWTSMEMKIGKTKISVEWEHNESVASLLKLAEKFPLTIKMSRYGDFEQVGSIGQSLPKSDRWITAQTGDIMLYSGNQIVVFYGSNSWNYTKLGKITGDSLKLIKELLSSEDVTITLTSCTKKRSHGILDLTKRTVLLNSGYEMPVIGLGTWTLSNEKAEETVYQALKSGMRLIDTARYYGNEIGIGRGLMRAISEGIVTRGDVFITGKIYGGNYERAGEIINDEIRDLNVDYIDLMLIHEPGADDEGVYKAMEEAVNDNRLRSIGISNYYTKESLDKVLSFATILPAVIQNENHIYFQNTELQEYARHYGIVIESWYPFGGRGHTAESFNNKIIAQMADKYGKSPAQIILRWHLQAGFIPIPGSSNPEHIAENYDIFDFELTDKDMEKIRQIDLHKRYENW